MWWVEASWSAQSNNTRNMVTRMTRICRLWDPERTLMGPRRKHAWRHNVYFLCVNSRDVPVCNMFAAKHAWRRALYFLCVYSRDVPVCDMFAAIGFSKKLPHTSHLLHVYVFKNSRSFNFWRSSGMSSTRNALRERLTLSGTFSICVIDADSACS